MDRTRYEKPITLLDHAKLEQSCIVANNRMNRERFALGSNGYEVEIGFDLIEFLIERYESNGTVRWLDLCCGRAKALIETGKQISDAGMGANTHIIGVDLVDMFDPVPDELDFVQLETESLHSWTTTLQFDLITCVHGLHYVGDKLDLIERAVSWLKPNGRFVASLGLENLRSPQNEISFDALLELNGFGYEKADHLLSFQANENRSTTIKFGLEFLGADDAAGPNYTKQEVVNSHYR